MDCTECEGCGRRCVPNRAWKEANRVQRDAFLLDGLVEKVTKRFCRTCYDRDRRGIPLDLPLQLPRSVIAEEWNWIANPWLSDEVNAENLAPRLGMTAKALVAAVSKLRRDGLVGPTRVAA